MTGDLRGGSASADRKAMDSGYIDRANRNKAIGAVIDRPAPRNNAIGSRDKETGAGQSNHKLGHLELP
jgi:hypothetical protein